MKPSLDGTDYGITNFVDLLFIALVIDTEPEEYIGAPMILGASGGVTCC